MLVFLFFLNIVLTNDLKLDYDRSLNSSIETEIKIVFKQNKQNETNCLWRIVLRRMKIRDKTTEY